MTTALHLQILTLHDQSEFAIHKLLLSWPIIASLGKWRSALHSQADDTDNQNLYTIQKDYSHNHGK